MELQSLAKNKEKVILMAYARDMQQLLNEVEVSLQELKALIEDLGGEVVAIVTQLRPNRHAAHYLGEGKIEEIKDLAVNLEADLLICDEELSGSQMRRLEEMTGLRVLDRTLVILDIFATRAQSKEGKIQVELALLQYRLSRLTQSTGELSRQGGGIGTKGPGETRLETDRRHIHRRIDQLKKELAEVAAHRDRLRQSRRRSGTYSVAVVGYTNAGKTTLVNYLCKADLEAADKLFATLDPAVRKMTVTAEELWELTGSYPKYFAPMLIDTVGFIRRLPHTLINAFHSTLQEAVDADIVLHLINASDPNALKHFEVAGNLLEELKVIGKPNFIVLNQVDRVENMEDLSELLTAVKLRVKELGNDSRHFIVSAKTGSGLDELRREILSYFLNC